VNEPEWTSPNHVTIELDAMRVRDFSVVRGKQRSTLIVAPFALHVNSPTGAELGEPIGKRYILPAGDLLSRSRTERCGGKVRQPFGVTVSGSCTKSFRPKGWVAGGVENNSGQTG
jgi:hypothetical protein